MNSRVLLDLDRAVTQGSQLLRQAECVRHALLEFDLERDVANNTVLGLARPIGRIRRADSVFDLMRRNSVHEDARRILLGISGVAHKLGFGTPFGFGPMLGDPSKLLSNNVLNNFSSVLRVADEQLRRQDSIACSVLAVSGWPALEFEFSRAERLDAFFHYTMAGRRRLSSYIRTQFRRRRYTRLNEVVARWWKVPYLKRNRAALCHAIRAHKREEYALSIPPLLNAIDGLTWEITQAVPPRNKQRVLNSGRRSPAILAPKVAERFYRFGGSGLVLAASATYQRYRFTPGCKPPSSINRHAIVHGKAGRYHTEENSLKLILLLEGFANIARALIKRGLMN